MTQVVPVARVLVVDDDEPVRSSIARALHQAGYEVVSTSSSREALRLGNTRPRFDVFVLDLMMPGMSGDELGRLLRGHNPDGKILYYNGFSDHLFDDSTSLFANEAFLDKPVSVIGLCEAVSLLLFGHTRGGTSVHDANESSASALQRRELLH